MIYKKYMKGLITHSIDAKVIKNLNYLLSKAECKTFKKGEIIVDIGNHTYGSYYVDQGVIKMYRIDEQGKEQIIQFASESWYVQLNESVVFKEPSEYVIQALEDCVIYIIDFSDTLDLMKKDHEYLEFVLKLYSFQLLQSQRRIAMLLNSNAMDKYQHFLTAYPDLQARINSSDIANYLGITKENFSRLKKKI